MERRNGHLCKLTHYLRPAHLANHVADERPAYAEALPERRQVCSGALQLTAAQNAIRTDWVQVLRERGL